MANNQILLKTVCKILKSGLTVHLKSDAHKNVEPKIEGYRHKALSEGDWKVLTGDDKIVAVGNWTEWEFMVGKANIYGFFVKDKDGEVLWDESYKDGPYEILRKGDKLRIRPKLTFEETQE